MQASGMDKRRELLSVIGVAVAILVLWHVPLFGWVFYPFQLFGTFIHEISHGLAAIITGGSFNRFVVNPDLSGVAWSAGGLRWVVSSAGYIGSALFGGLLVLLAARRMPARRVLYWLGIALGVLCLLFVRNLFGVLSGLVLASALVLAGQRLRVQWAEWLLLILGVQLMLDGVNSLFSLVFLSARSTVTTDAAIMAQATGVPSLIWAVLWTVASLGILAATLRLAYGRR
ncbi:MAG: M50 family metallopeptidase [Roseiflexaceae bacterium]|nr:M50 family metallopeptidase [Roseiflexaceae bacterium]